MNLLCFLISKLKNATRSNKKYIISPKNLLCFNFLKLLVAQGFISSICEINGGKLLKIYLKYEMNGSPSFKQIKLYTSPGKISYLSFLQLAMLEQGVGVFLLSTNEGLLTSQVCLKRKIAGNLFCHIS